MIYSIVFKADVTIYSGPRFTPVAKGRSKQVQHILYTALYSTLASTHLASHSQDMGAIGGIFKLLAMHHFGAAILEVPGLTFLVLP